jgi:hypothetical protein
LVLIGPGKIRDVSSRNLTLARFSLIKITEGSGMLEVTKTAISNLKAYLEQNSITSALRVALMQGG